VTAIYNEEAYVVEGLPETVDVTLIGSKADLYFAKQSGVHEISVDLSDLKPGSHKVELNYLQGLKTIDYSVNPSVATVIIYSKISETKTLTLDVLNQDSLDPKLVIKNINIGSDQVIVKGAEHQLKKVATVKALIDVKNFAKQEVGTFEIKDIPLKAYDEQGNAIDVEIVPAKITATVEIVSPSKEVPIKITPVGDVAFGYALNTIELSEATVVVYGPEDILNNIKNIPSEINVEGLTESRQYKKELTKPVGVKSFSVNNVTVNVTLAQVTERIVNDVNIEYRNLNSDKYTAEGMSANDIKVSVSLKGVSTVIEAMEASDIKAYIDLSGYAPGVYDIPVKVEGNDVRVQYLSKTTTVRIRSRQK
jgi:YbbR domain-containing protein